MAGQLKISVIIPTYNGAHKIVNLLDSLINQTKKPDEVIVVIDGSNDNTLDVLQDYKGLFNNFNIIEQENQGRARVRNNGATKAKSDIILYIDDDMIAEDYLVEKHYNHHNYYNNCICVGYQKDLSRNLKNDFGDFRNWLNKKWIKIDSNKSLILLDSPYITASNFSLPKEIFFKLGMFNSSLNDSEDYELAVRAFDFKIPIYLNFEALAYHDEIYNSSYKSYIIRQRQYFLSREHLNKIGTSNNYTSKNRGNKLKSIFFYFFANRVWVNLLENERLLFLPKIIRYKLYDIIITANSFYFPYNVNL